MIYNRITKSIIDELTQIVGERFITTDEEKLEPYSHDEVADK